MIKCSLIKGDIHLGVTKYDTIHQHTQIQHQYIFHGFELNIPI